jgi:hypothetical protein
MSFQLRPDQIEDLAALIVNPRHIHGGEPGTGKTPTVCVNQAYRWREHQTGTVWAMPKSLMRKNLEEAMRWGGWEDGDVVIVDGTKKQCDRALESGAKVFIMGFTRFAKCWRQLPDHVRAFDADEWHKGFGGHESKRTQELYSFMDERGDFFTAMTGTLVKGKPESAYPALQIIEPRYYGTLQLFQNVHHVKDPWTGRLAGYRDLEILHDVLSKHIIKRRWKDIHGDKLWVPQVERVDMAPQQRTIYDQFEAEAILELENFFIDGTQPGVAFTRARQIMEHPNRFPDLRDPDKLPPVDILPGEMPAKMELLDLHFTNALENGTPIVVFANLIPNQRQILDLGKSLGLEIEWMSGEASLKERDQIDSAFRAGRLKALVCSPLIADCGFNWQFCGDHEVDHCVFANMDFLDTTFIQARDRFMRQKRSSALRVSILVYRQSVDEHILRLVTRASRTAHQVDPDREVLLFTAINGGSSN